MNKSMRTQLLLRRETIDSKLVNKVAKVMHQIWTGPELEEDDFINFVSRISWTPALIMRTIDSKLISEQCRRKYAPWSVFEMSSKPDWSLCWCWWCCCCWWRNTLLMKTRMVRGTKMVVIIFENSTLNPNKWVQSPSPWPFTTVKIWKIVNHINTIWNDHTLSFTAPVCFLESKLFRRN